MMLGDPNCTPGYYNNEGQPLGPTAQFNVGYPFGPSAFFSHLSEWRESGLFAGLEFR